METPVNNLQFVLVANQTIVVELQLRFPHGLSAANRVYGGHWSLPASRSVDGQCSRSRPGAAVQGSKRGNTPGKRPSGLGTGAWAVFAPAVMPGWRFA